MKVTIDKIKVNPKNPRILKDSKYNSLKKSLEDFPEMLEKRPLVVFTDKDNKYVVLGGNMRFKVAKELGFKELPIILADDWTEEQKTQFLIKDNINYGDWDWDALANEWDSVELKDWGLEIFHFPDEVDYSILDDFGTDNEGELNRKIEQKSDDITKGITIPFDIEHYDKTSELLKKLLKIEHINLGAEIYKLFEKLSNEHA